MELGQHLWSKVGG